MKRISEVVFALAIAAVSSFSVPPIQKFHGTTNHQGTQVANKKGFGFIKPLQTLKVSSTQLQSAGDPRIDNVDSQFKAIMAGVGKAFGGIAQAKHGRATHTFGSTGRGRLTVLSNPDIPAHKYFSPNRSYPVLARHANIKGFKDDGIRDGRGITLRLLDGNADAATNTLNLNNGVLDVLASTGPCFILNNAVDFAQWVSSDLDGRGAMLKTHPKITPIFEEIIKNPDSYTKLHYYSEPSYQFVAEDGSFYFMRYRVLNADKSADTGYVPPQEVMLPQDFSPRPPSDKRPETYLQDDFRSRVNSPGGVNYLLQVQLRPVTTDLALNQEAMDCTIAWDESDWPMRDVAIIHLDEVVPDEVVEPLSFSPYNAPAELGLILATTATDTASINQLRSVVYEFSAKMRNGEPLPDSLKALMRPFPEVFKGVYLPDNQMPGLAPNPYTVAQVGKYLSLAGEKVAAPLLNQPKDSLKPAEAFMKEINDLQRTVPSGNYKFFGNGINHAKELELLLKTNPFMVSALTETKNGFELKSYDPKEKKPSRFLQYMRTLNGVGHRVNFEFTKEMKLKSFEVFDDIEGRVIPGELDVQKYASSAIYNLFFYASCIHSTIHVLQFLMTSGFEAASKDFEAMNEWAVSYAKNIGIKYEQVAALLITDPQPPGTERPALITNPNGVGSSQVIRPMLKDLLDMWGQSPKAKDFLKNMMNIPRNKMEKAGILTEFMKHFDLIEPFAASASKALHKIDPKAFNDAEGRLKQYLKRCGSFKSNIDTVDTWIQLMSVTGIVHGCTLSYSRFLGLADIARWRNYLGKTWDPFDINLITGVLGTIVGMESGRHVMTSTGATTTFAKELQEVLDDYDSKVSVLKAEYKTDLLKSKDFDEYGFILSDYGPDNFDGKQLTIATYI